MKKQAYVEIIKAADSYTDEKGKGFINGVITCVANDPDISFFDYVDIREIIGYFESVEERSQR